MSSIIQQGLMITVIGMGLVFAVIIFLWWLMGLLVRATTKPEVVSLGEPVDVAAVDELPPPEMSGTENRRRAAAAAVAVAIGQSRGRRLQGASAGMSGMSPWQSLHRARQLEQLEKRG